MASSSSSSFCPFSLFLFAVTAGAYTHSRFSKSRLQDSSSSSSSSSSSAPAAKVKSSAGVPSSSSPSSSEDNNMAKDPYSVVFVLGGPGSGKGTQCDLLRTRLGWAHLSAGDLLRAERNSGSELAGLINSNIAAGKIVPAEITVSLLERAMEKERAGSGKSEFLIDGFPRSEGNVSAWDGKMTETGRADVKAVLFLDCPEETMTGRLLERGKSSGRNDDNLDVIRKRFETFRGESMPIVERYEKMGKVRKVKADRGVEDVYKDVKEVMESL